NRSAGRAATCRDYGCRARGSWGGEFRPARHLAHRESRWGAALAACSCTAGGASSRPHVLDDVGFRTVVDEAEHEQEAERRDKQRVVGERMLSHDPTDLLVALDLLLAHVSQNRR